jgi:hypothetical protein
VFQTAGLPPSFGSTIFANIGWTRKTSADAVNVVAVKSHTVERPDACTRISRPAVEIMILLGLGSRVTIAH